MRLRKVDIPTARSVSWITLFPGGRGRPSFLMAMRSCRTALQAMWRRATDCMLSQRPGGLS
jgi:hypothetical protein